MEFRELSKLQIRSEVMLMLQRFNSIDEMSKEQQDRYLTKLRSIKDIDYVVEILVKELARVDYSKAQLISVFLQELGTLEFLQEILWSYIKSPKSSDELKDISGIILKSLGDQTDPEEFLNYLNDPRAIVDKETEKLLEIASVNPEAKIDFLDFLFSLPETEQINLVSSLKDDYSSEHLVNVAVPALEAKPSLKLEETLIKILGETRSRLAVPALTDIIKYSQNDFIKKQAHKSLSMLKLSGINIELNDFSGISPMTKTSSIYECHTNIVDGIGNQGIIISRIKPNMDILMMNIVVNDIHGIIDCFGFYGISKQDFKRIIEKFQETTTGFIVSPEYCKLKLLQAEKINKENGLSIPYEYAAWKSLLDDISPMEDKWEETANTFVDKKLINETALLYKFPDFEQWFFEEDDHPFVDKFIEDLKKEIENSHADFAKNHKKLLEWFKSKIDLFAEKVFDDELKIIYKNRLLDIAYLLNYKDLDFFKEISASLAWAIDPKNNCDIKTIPFFKELIKRTIIEALLRYQLKIEQDMQKAGKDDSYLSIFSMNLEEIIDVLSE